MHTEFWLKLDSDGLEDLGVGGRTVFKWILKK
jgi:hypothetical protein